MDDVDHLGECLPLFENLSVTAVAALHREFSTEYVSRVGHRVCVPGEGGVWRNLELQQRQLRGALGVAGIRRTVPGCAALQQDLPFDWRKGVGRGATPVQEQAGDERERAVVHDLIR